jgi:uncharacterized protein YndB with AHSA1/START domain
MTPPRHVYQTYVRATPEQIWSAITDPEFTCRYLFGSAFESSLEPGSGYRLVQSDGSETAAGVIEEADPPHRLVMTWRALWDPALADEPPGRVEWELTPCEPPGDDQVTRVRLMHRDLAMSPRTSAYVRDGWAWVVDNLKTLVETGTPLPGGPIPEAQSTDPDGELHRSLGVEINNATFDLLSRDRLGPVEREDLVRGAYAAAYHWARAARRGPENSARAEYLIAKAHIRAGQPAPALTHAQRCAQLVSDAGLTDFDLAYSHEVCARALALNGDESGARREWAAALAVPIADDEDRTIVEKDFADAQT